MDDKYPKIYKNELETIGEAVITQWYDTYDPIFYNRIGRLYKMYNIRLTDDQCIGDFNFPLIGVDEIIYYNSFVMGAHGGARDGVGHPSPGLPYWRKPMGIFNEWGRPAKVSFSPLLRMQNEMTKKIKIIDKMKNDEFNSVIEKIYKAIKRL